MTGGVVSNEAQSCVFMGERSEEMTVLLHKNVGMCFRVFPIVRVFFCFLFFLVALFCGRKEVGVRSRLLFWQRCMCVCVCV